MRPIHSIKLIFSIVKVQCPNLLIKYCKISIAIRLSFPLVPPFLPRVFPVYCPCFYGINVKDASYRSRLHSGTSTLCSIVIDNASIMFIANKYLYRIFLQPLAH